MPAVTAVSVDGATNSPTTSRADDGEVMLDIQVAGAVQGYSAGPGWNACTGLGTPDGTAILNKL